MRHSAQLRMGTSEQQTSRRLQEKTVTLRANRIKKSLDYTKMENPLYVGQPHEPRQTAGEEHEGHLRTVTNHNEPITDNGLVKHMRNLPGYLQRVEKGENVQGKALNFGVLDWGRLENWKSNEKRIPPRYNMKRSLSSNNSTLVETGSVKFSKSKKKVYPPRRDQQASHGSPLNSSCRERLPPGVRWPRGKPVKPQIFESRPCSNVLPPGGKDHIRELDSSNGKQAADQTTPEKEETSTSGWRKQGSDDPCPRGKHNSLPISSDDFHSSSSSHDDLWISDSRKSRDDHLIEENESRLSNCLSPGECLSLNHPISDVPHSCPFPLPLSEPECPMEIPVTPLRGGSLEENSKASKKCDLDIDDQPALKGRHSSSPNRRFSFNFGKMARSFSFKESTSSIPQLSPTYISAKSGPVNFEASPDLVNHNWKKGHATIPSRSSPLRRLLDPLLKLKGAHLSEKVQKSKLDLNPTSVPLINKDELLFCKKYISSNVQALLQLTLKNGIPFFKLVIESSSDILAAAVKKLPSGKDDSSLIYAFYSVHETKKKSGGWIYQGLKEKSYSFGYNIVGQMKISSSYHAEFSGAEKDLYVVRESVLYSSDIMQADEKRPDCMLDGELAAIIVKNPSDETCGDIGSSKSTIVVLPEGVHSWPNSHLPSPLINRWRSGGACDCGGWDIGCQFHVLSHHQTEILKTSTPSTLCTTSDCLDLSYQVGHKNKCSFRLVSLEGGLYSLEYDPSMSLLQAFSICVAVVSSQKLTHIFQVNYIPESKDLSENKATGHEKVKIQEEIPQKYVSKPPASPVGRV